MNHFKTILLILFSFLVQTEINLVFGSACDKYPEPPAGEEPFDAACKGTEAGYKCGVTSETLACKNAKIVDKQLKAKFKEARTNVCAKVDAYNAAQQNCTTNGAADCQTTTGTKLSEAKAEAESAAKELEFLVETQESWRQELLKEITEAKQQAEKETTDRQKEEAGHAASFAPRECLDKAHGRPTEGHIVVADEGKILSDASPKVSAGMSPLDRSYVKTLELIKASKDKANTEIRNLRNIAAGLGPMSKTSLTRGKQLNSKTPESTITGDTKNPASASPQQQAGGGAPPGGGGPPSGGQPSTVSDPTATPAPPITAMDPTPNGTNSGKKLTESDDKTKVKDPTNLVNADIDKNLSKDGTTRAIPTLGSSFPALKSSSESDSPTSLKKNGGGKPATTGAVGGGTSGPVGSSTLGAVETKAVTATSDPGLAAKTAAGPKGGDGGGGGTSAEDVLSPFGKPLSDPNFTLAGSDTDATVKNLVGNFGTEPGDQASRDPAGDYSDGIGEKNSISLFERVRSFHDRCLHNGCVAGHSKRKVGGG